MDVESGGTNGPERGAEELKVELESVKEMWEKFENERMDIVSNQRVIVSIGRGIHLVFNLSLVV